jgi:murein endopeptidase
VSALAGLALAATSLVTLALEHASAPVEWDGEMSDLRAPPTSVTVESDGEMSDLLVPVRAPTAPADGVVVDEFKARADAFSRFRDPLPGRAGVFGGYSNGCLLGGVALPRSGTGFELMRLGRNRRYGHPALVAFIQRLGASARMKKVGTLLVGDLAQPRGGPTPTGHRSHQTGLDVDIGFTRPDFLAKRRIKTAEREQISQLPVVDLATRTLTAHWKPDIETLIRIAATDPEVDRVFVNPRIKRELCERATAEAAAIAEKLARDPGAQPRKGTSSGAKAAPASAGKSAAGKTAATIKSTGGAAGKSPATAALASALDRSWLQKVRPWYGHHDHLHARLKCPADSPGCESQGPLPPGDGCNELAWWETDEALRGREPPIDPLTGKPRPPPPLPPLPETCQALINPTPVATGNPTPAPPRR